MFAPLSTVALFPALILLLTVPTVIAAESPKTAATPSKDMPVYKPPKRGAPASRVGGGARGAEAGSLVLSVLAPAHTGWTAKAQPTLYWYLSEPANTRVELTVIDDASIAPLLEIESPPKAGMQSLRLADHRVYLKPGMEYQWSVALVRDPRQRSQDIVASGTLTYVEPSAELKQKLTPADKEALASIYAGEGYWYDAIESLSELIESQPQDKRLREMRASLLEQVALPEVAEYDRK